MTSSVKFPKIACENAHILLANRGLQWEQKNKHAEPLFSVSQCWQHTPLSLGFLRTHLTCKRMLLAPLHIGISEYLKRGLDYMNFVKSLPNDASSQNCEPLAYISDAKNIINQEAVLGLLSLLCRSRIYLAGQRVCQITMTHST